MRLLHQHTGARIAVVAVAAALLALPAPGHAPAQATGYGPATAASSGAHHPTWHGTRYDGNAWAGYVASGGNFHTITGSWTQPEVTCTGGGDMFAPWVGIDGYGSQTVEQVGVQVDCSSGSPVTSPWWEMYPQPPVFWNDQVNPGDTMTGTVTDNGGEYTLTLADQTQGWTETTRQSIDNAQDASAEAVTEAPQGNTYPSFTVRFSNVTVDGQVFDSASPQPVSGGGYSPGPLQNGSFQLSSDGGGGAGGGGWPWSSRTPATR